MDRHLGDLLQWGGQPFRSRRQTCHSGRKAWSRRRSLAETPQRLCAVADTASQNKHSAHYSAEPRKVDAGGTSGHDSIRVKALSSFNWRIGISTAISLADGAAIYICMSESRHYGHWSVCRCQAAICQLLAPQTKFALNDGFMIRPTRTADPKLPFRASKTAIQPNRA